MEEIIKTLLYVDEGDTCCAPMAAAFAEKLAAEKGIKLTFGSAGVFTVEGLTIDPLAVRAAQELYGVTLKTSGSRQLTPEVFAEYDRVTSMLYRLNVFVNEKAHRWPNAGNFSIVKPVGKDYESYKTCAKKLYENIGNQMDSFLKSGHVVTASGK